MTEVADCSENIWEHLHSWTSVWIQSRCPMFQWFLLPSLGICDDGNREGLWNAGLLLRTDIEVFCLIRQTVSVQVLWYSALGSDIHIRVKWPCMHCNISVPSFDICLLQQPQASLLYTQGMLLWQYCVGHCPLFEIVFDMHSIFGTAYLYTDRLLITIFFLILSNRHAHAPSKIRLLFLLVSQYTVAATVRNE